MMRLILLGAICYCVQCVCVREAFVKWWHALSDAKKNFHELSNNFQLHFNGCRLSRWNKSSPAKFGRKLTLKSEKTSREAGFNREQYGNLKETFLHSCSALVFLSILKSGNSPQIEFEIQCEF